MKETPAITAADKRAAQERQRQLAALIDEYGTLEEKVTPLRPALKRLEEIGKLLRGELSSKDPAFSYTISGEQYDLIAGPMKEETHIVSLALVFGKLGKQKFLSACSFTLKALRGHLGAAGVEEFTRKTRTGPRNLTVRKRA